MEKTESNKGVTVAWVWELFPQLALAFFFVRRVESSKSRLPHPATPICPTVPSLPYLPLVPLSTTRCTRTSSGSATLALYTNIKVPGQLWGLPCVFVLFCEFFFSFGVLEFALTMPFSPSRFVRERDVVMVPSSWDAT